MKFSAMNVAAIVLVVALFAGVIYATGAIKFQAYGLEEAVFCQDYEFVCAGLHQSGTTQNSVLAKGNVYTCESDECYIYDISGGTLVYGEWLISISPFNATCGVGWLGDAYCNPSTTRNVNNPFTLKIGEKFVGGTNNVVYSSIRKDVRLVWCGDAACDAGVTGIDVHGSTKNTFVTDKRIYDPSGNVLRQPSAAGISYTVPSTSCVLSPKSQFICGTKFSQCTKDSDCAAGHTYLVDGKGAEARTGILDIYGCKILGQAPTTEQTDVLPKDNTPSSTTYNYGNQCGVIDSRQVQCTSDVMCGSNAFCDTKTFTCVAQEVKECTADWNCGTQNVYDQPTKQIRKPFCSLGKCSYQVVKTVQCFYNSECATGWFCDTDYTCKEAIQPKQSCPYECCVGDPRYFDRPAPTGKVCCPSGKVADTQTACAGQPIPPQPQINYVLIFSVLIGVIIFFTVYSRYKKEENVVKFGISTAVAIIAFILSYLILDFIATWWWALIIAGIVGGGLIVYFFGAAVVIGALAFILGRK